MRFFTIEFNNKQNKQQTIVDIKSSLQKLFILRNNSIYCDKYYPSLEVKFILLEMFIFWDKKSFILGTKSKYNLESTPSYILQQANLWKGRVI